MVKFYWGALVGGVAAYKFQPIQADLARRHALFRKAWMRFPLQMAVFAGFSLTAIQIPNRMSKLLGHRGVTQDMAMSATDIVGKFRMFENSPGAASAEQNLVNYLHEYSDRPFVKDELLLRLKEMEKNGHHMRVKRIGKDQNDFFWLCGKIHGLENIALLTDEELKEVNGNPIKLQLLINKTENRRKSDASYEEVQSNLEEYMNTFKS